MTQALRRLRRAARRLPGALAKPVPGHAPGLSPEQLAAVARDQQAVPGAAVEPTTVCCYDYAPDRCTRRVITDLPAFLAQPLDPAVSVRWINIDGLSDLGAIASLAEHFGLHPLAVEDMLHTPQRPKFELFPPANGDSSDHASTCNDLIFIVLIMARLVDDAVTTEQVSLFLRGRVLLTFQEPGGDVWEPIRQRLMQDGSKLRQQDASFLAYAMLDAVVDHHFPILEFYGDKLETLEARVLEDPRPTVINQIHAIKRELLLLRREVWPLREAVNQFQREPSELVSNATRTFLRDVHDHAVAVIELIETYRELAGGLAETYLSSVSVRMNQVMKVLTIFASIFIPLTFLAGVYGMNFKYLPELEWKWSYPLFWGVCLAVAGGMLAWFRKQKWL
ncbi:MAG: magnesium/cobalt transporter CorA [Phycisphaeraceae bacterium]|nr:magnesium/cobalt transporter CorA [Phycisphaeraceae bacterium]